MTAPQAPSVPTVKLPEEIHKALNDWKDAIHRYDDSMPGFRDPTDIYIRREAIVAAIVKFGRAQLESQESELLRLRAVVDAFVAERENPETLTAVFELAQALRAPGGQK